MNTEDNNMAEIAVLKEKQDEISAKMKEIRDGRIAALRAKRDALMAERKRLEEEFKVKSEKIRLELIEIGEALIELDKFVDRPR